MEMRAIDDVSMSSDLTPPLRPIAAALHPQFLQFHCSSCFRSILFLANQTPRPNTNLSPLLSCCSASLRYCSRQCLQSDSSIHLSSGECHLLRSEDCVIDDDITDVRVGLRLLHSFEKLGVKGRFGRFGGLLSSSSDVVEMEGGDWEIARRVKEGGMLMAAARGGRSAGDRKLEEAALWAVVINGVDVLEIGATGGGGIGVAVYGPMFSWFNHSCSPNACYRFEMGELGADDSAGLFKIYPHCQGEGETHLLKSWNVDEEKSSQGDTLLVCVPSAGAPVTYKYTFTEFSRFGPRIIVRSIKPIGKHVEVCISYTDLMQPKALRSVDLWQKYRFTCCCSRCSAYPETYVDRVLSGRTDNMIGKNSDSCSDDTDKAVQNISDILDQAIVEYLSGQDPAVFCEKIESKLSKALQSEQVQVVPSRRNFRFHPLHHMALSTYIALASAYRIQMTNSLMFNSDQNTSLESCGTSRATIGYSLLLAGAINHLFFSEMSLVGAASIFWINAGESLVNLLKCSMSDSAMCWVNVSEFLSLFSLSDATTTTSRECIALDQTQFLRTCFRLQLCIEDLCLRVWPSLSADLPYLKDIKDPVDFSWTGISKDSFHPLVTAPCPSSKASECHKKTHMNCIGCRCETDLSITDERRKVIYYYQLGIHCLVYGGYLARIYYGSECSLISNVKELVIFTEHH